MNHAELELKHATEEIVLDIPLELVLVSEHNPRKPKMTDPGIKAMADSIGRLSQTTAAIVRPHPTEEGKYELAAGTRRYTALMLLNKPGQMKRMGFIDQEPPTTIRAEVFVMEDDVFREIMFTENNEREDLSPMEEAEFMKKMIGEYGKDWELLESLTGKTRSQLSRSASLTRLTPIWLMMLDKGCVRKETALAAAKYSEHIQNELIDPDDWNNTGKEDVIEEDLIDDMDSWERSELWGLTPGYIKNQAERRFLELKHAAWDINDPDLITAVGSCAACPKRTGATPELFEEFSELGELTPDRCQDEECFKFKHLQHLKNTRDKLGKEMLAYHEFNALPPLPKCYLVTRKIAQGKTDRYQDTRFEDPGVLGSTCVYYDDAVTKQRGKKLPNLDSFPCIYIEDGEVFYSSGIKVLSAVSEQLESESKSDTGVEGAYVSSQNTPTPEKQTKSQKVKEKEHEGIRRSIVIEQLLEVLFEVKELPTTISDDEALWLLLFFGPVDQKQFIDDSHWPAFDVINKDRFDAKFEYLYRDHISSQWQKKSAGSFREYVWDCLKGTFCQRLKFQTKSDAWDKREEDVIRVSKWIFFDIEEAYGRACTAKPIPKSWPDAVKGKGPETLIERLAKKNNDK